MYLPNVELKPLRKNARNCHYRVLTMDASGCVTKVTSYETMREAIYHAIINKNGDIIERGAPKGSGLKAFYCKWCKTMRFGFGSSQFEKERMMNDFSWAKWDTMPLEKR